MLLIHDFTNQVAAVADGRTLARSTTYSKVDTGEGEDMDMDLEGAGAGLSAEEGAIELAMRAGQRQLGLQSRGVDINDTALDADDLDGSRA
jgi:hypothetical protein